MIPVHDRFSVKKCPVVTPWVAYLPETSYFPLHYIGKSIFLAFVIKKIGGSVIEAEEEALGIKLVFTVYQLLDNIFVYTTYVLQ